MLIELFTYFQSKKTFLTASGWSGSFEFLFWFSSALLLFKMKSLFFNLWKFAKFFMPILKAQDSFPSNYASIFSAIKHNFSVHFSSNIIYFGQSSPLNNKFFRLSRVLGSKFIKFLKLISKWQFLFKFCIVLHRHNT